jgi:hypothetical protein
MSDPVGALKITQETSTGSIQIELNNKPNDNIMRDHIKRHPLYYLFYQGMSDPVGALKMKLQPVQFKLII